MRITTVSSLAVAALAIVAVGCGGSDNGSSSTPAPTATAAATTTATATATPAAGSHALTVKMTEFAFAPKVATAPAGKLKLTAVNDGKIVHELVLLKTNADPANLPKNGDEVDESSSVGEIADVEAGQTKSNTFNLKAGKYAMVCALPGHYEGGMYGSLTVK